MSNIDINQQPQAAVEREPDDEAREAFDATALERDALEVDEFASPTFDFGQAVDTVLAAVPRIRSLQKELDALPFSKGLTAKLETYALAAAHSHALVRIAMTPPEELDETYQTACEKRTVLKHEAVGLAGHKLVNREAVAALKSENGFRNVAYELMSYVALFREAGDRIVGRTTTTSADLDRAAALATKLLRLGALRDSRHSLAQAAMDERRRAFTLMQNAYDEVRRALHYLRWHHGDAAEIAPSLYAHRGGRRRDVEEGPTTVGAPSTTPTTTNASSAVVPVSEAGPVGHLAADTKAGNPFAE